MLNPLFIGSFGRVLLVIIPLLGLWASIIWGI